MIIHLTACPVPHPNSKCRTLRRRLPTRISAYPNTPVKIKLNLMSCQNVCSVPGDWTYAFTGPMRHRWLHTQVGVRKRAYLGRKRALIWAVGTLSQTDYFSLTAVKIWQAVVANVPGLNVLLNLGVKYVWTLVLHLLTSPLAKSLTLGWKYGALWHYVWAYGRILDLKTVWMSHQKLQSISYLFACDSRCWKRGW